VTVCLDREALKSTLIKMSTGLMMVMSVVTPHVRNAEPAHESRQRPIAIGPQHQVPVVGHQAEGEQIDGISLEGLVKHLEKGRVIARLVEEFHPAVAAIEDMVNASGLDGSRGSGHADRVPEMGSGSNMSDVPLSGSNTANALYHFSGVPDGAGPVGTPILIGTTLYGMTSRGGTATDGTIYSYNLATNSESVLHSFTGSPDGDTPYGSVVQMGSMLYGMTSQGGNQDFGTLFSYSFNGGAFTILHSFGTGGGADPEGDLLVDGQILYGMTSGGGVGTVYSFNTMTNTFTNLHSFDVTDGANPDGDLTLVGDTLYGMTYNGGANGDGVIFSIVLPEPTTAALILAISGPMLLRRRRRMPLGGK